MGSIFLSVGSALDPIEVPGITVEEEVPSQEILIGGQEVTVPGVPSKNVTTPEVHVDHTCLPMGLICVGPATFVPEQHLLTTPGTENETHSVPELLEENTPSIGIKVVLDDVSGTVDPLGPPSELGPLTLHIPNPFGGEPLPITVCAEGCPLPVSVGSNLVESGLTVAVFVDGEELHSMHLPIRLATGPGEGPYAIHGTVMDGDSRQPMAVSGAVVTATPEGDGECTQEVTTVTAATGRYVLLLPCDGDYNVSVTHPLYFSAAEVLSTGILDADTIVDDLGLDGGTGDFELGRLTNEAVVTVWKILDTVPNESVIITGEDVDHTDTRVTAATNNPEEGNAVFPGTPWGVYTVTVENSQGSMLVVYPLVHIQIEEDRSRPRTLVIVE